MRDDQPPRPPRSRKSTGERLREALIALGGGLATVTSHTDRNWASITFAGARHRIALAFDGAQAVERGEHFIVALPDHEFVIPGQLVADAAVLAVDHRFDPPRMEVSCEVLMLDDA